MTHWQNSMILQRPNEIMTCAQDCSTFTSGPYYQYLSPQYSEYDDASGDDDRSDDGETDDEYHGEAGPSIKRVRFFPYPACSCFACDGSKCYL